MLSQARAYVSPVCSTTSSGRAGGGSGPWRSNPDSGDSRKLLQPLEDGLEPLDVAPRAARLIQPGFVQRLAPLGGVLAERLAQRRSVLVGVHGGRLDQGVGILPSQPPRDQLEQHR